MNITKIFYEEACVNSKTYNEITNKFRDAELVRVNSHWNIPEINQNEKLVEQWNYTKTNWLILGIKKSLECRPNGRSTDRIAPSLSNGCYSACSYCYVARRKGFSNPITLFTNVDAITDALLKDIKPLGKKTPNQCDEHKWTYDIGENSDCSIDAMLCSNVPNWIEMFSKAQKSKICFATKTVNYDLLKLNPKGNTRIRFSVMPENYAKVLDIRTSPITERLLAINEFVKAGYEVHINISPVIVEKDWISSYITLLQQINEACNDEARKQLKCEVIFLTHNENLHDLNMKWHPKGENLIWKPEIQEQKISETGGCNLRYNYKQKNVWIKDLTNLIQKYTPYMKIRYIF
jgi:spore photoproduct lyase family protein